MLFIQWMYTTYTEHMNRMYFNVKTGGTYNVYSTLKHLMKQWTLYQHKIVVVSGSQFPDMCPAHITKLLKPNIYPIYYINNLLQKSVPADMPQTGFGWTMTWSVLAHWCLFYVRSSCFYRKQKVKLWYWICIGFLLGSTDALPGTGAWSHY